MAIFYDYIKGCSQTTENKTSGYWTYLMFDENTPPQIYTSTKGTYDNTAFAWGHIVTTGMGNQNLSQSIIRPTTIKNLTIGTDLQTPILTFTATNKPLYCFKYYNDGISLVDSNNNQNYLYWDFTIRDQTVGKLEINLPLEVKTASAFQQSVNIQQSLSVDNNVTIANKCEALYFNSTSDARAKKDIQPLFTSVLDVIKSLQVYRFSYKSDETHEPVIGLLAQEANQFEIEDFSLVSNAAASGENGDYMSIKESKLVYILWKAIQEQQEEIEALQAEIKELKK